MKRLLVLWFVGLVLSATLRAADTSPLPAPATSVTALEAQREGRELAARLRDSVPDRESEVKGLLLVTSRDGQVTETPIVSRISITASNWQVTYHAPPRGSLPGETLTICHAQNTSNRYEFKWEGPASPPPLGKGAGREDELFRPFAGSDFWIIDLGLEFLHWPQQRKIKHEMRRSRACHVLESLNPHPQPPAGSYARVLSWIDVETGGLIRAEAYESGGGNRPLKEFELGSLRKVEGQHQLESMKIRSRKTGQETELKFDLRTK